MKALVLSAGGMFGAWQAGAWLALSRVFRPDLVVGASIGALNGWMIASRCEPGDLVDRWTGHRFNGDGEGRTGANGFATPALISGAPVLGLAREIATAHRPELPLAVVCTRVPRLSAHIFQGDELTAEHLYASCAVPVLLPAQRLPDGHVYADGGFLGPLPLWAAAKLGATRILAVHVLPPMPFWLGWKISLFRSLARHDDSVAEGVEVIRVGPERQLGSLRDSAVWDGANVRRWIREGSEAGERAAARL